MSALAVSATTKTATGTARRRGNASAYPAPPNETPPIAEIFRTLWHNSSDLSAFEKCLEQLIARLEPGLKLHELHEILPEDSEFDLLSLANTMANLGYHESQLRLAPFDVDARLLPCLFIPGSSHEATGTQPMVILETYEGDSGAVYKIYRSDLDTVVELEDTDSIIHTTGIAVFFKKPDLSEIATSKQVMADHNWKWFRAVFSRFSNLLWSLAGIAIGLNIVALASPIFTMLVYDRIIAPRDIESLPMLALGAALALVVELVLRLQRTRLLSRLTARIHYIVGTEVFKHLIELPPSLAQKASLTAQISRVKSFESVKDFFSGPLFVSTLDLPTILISTVVLAVFSLYLALIPLISAIFFVAVFFSMRHFVSKAIRVAATESSIAQRFCVETFQDREEIRANGLIEAWRERYREISGRDHMASAHLSFLSAISEHLSYGLGTLTAMFALVVGVNLVWAGSITTGMLVASLLLTWRAITPFYSLCSQVARFEQFRNSVRQVNLLMEVETELESREAFAKLPSITGTVDFQNVTLRFSRESGFVLTNFNAHIDAGEKVAICGSMGSGKSSLLALIKAIAEPTTGKVLIDGYNLRQLEAKALRRQITYVPQLPQTYPGSIAENLRVVKPNATDEELWRVLERAGADNAVRALPHGMDEDHHVFRNNFELLHRIAFARAFLQRSRLILIDEVSSFSGNDGLTELLTELIEESAGQRTIIFVSQRLDHLRMADKVIGLRPGKSPIVGTLDTILEAAA